MMQSFKYHMGAVEADLSQTCWLLPSAPSWSSGASPLPSNPSRDLAANFSLLPLSSLRSPAVDGSTRKLQKSGKLN
jgi:hypothetical protein